jgi:hypothetical protein
VLIVEGSRVCRREEDVLHGMGASVSVGHKLTLAMADAAQRERARARPLSLLDYDEGDVQEFLCGLGLEQYGPQIHQHQITGDILQAIDSDSLKEIGITSVGQRLSILKAVYAQKIQDGIPIEPDHYIPPCMSSSFLLILILNNLAEVAAPQVLTLSQLHVQIQQLGQSYAHHLCIPSSHPLYRATDSRFRRRKLSPPGHRPDVCR